MMVFHISLVQGMGECQDGISKWQNCHSLGGNNGHRETLDDKEQFQSRGYRERGIRNPSYHLVQVQSKKEISNEYDMDKNTVQWSLKRSKEYIRNHLGIRREGITLRDGTYNCKEVKVYYTDPAHGTSFRYHILDKKKRGKKRQNKKGSRKA